MKRSLKLYFRTLSRHKTTSVVTIGGFAISLAIFLVIFTYVVNEKQFDIEFTNIDNMYRLVRNGDDTNVPKKSLEKILSLSPEIENLCLYNRNSILFRYDNNKSSALFLKANDDFFSVFSPKFIHGNSDDVLKAKENLVITEDFAQKLFGSTNCIGEVIEMPDGEKKIVKAVIESPGKKSSLHYDIIFNLDNEYFNSRYCTGETCYDMFNAAMVINSSIDPKVVENKILNSMADYKPFKDDEITLQAYRNIYFDTKTKDRNHKHANIKLIKLLSFVALIILVLTILNYINLSISSNLDRFREICIRKSSGARNITIIKQFITESYLSCFIALLFAFIFVFLFSSVFTAALDLDFSVSDIFNEPIILFSCLGIILILGIIVGFLPAKIASMFNPVELIRSKTTSYKSNWLGVLNTLQFSISIVLIICLGMISKQINFVKSKKLGFETENLLRIRMEGDLSSNSKSIKNELLKHTTINGATLTQGNPMNIWSWGSGSFTVDGEEIEVKDVNQLPVDEDFLKTFNIPLIMGRNFSSTDVKKCIINETFLKSLGWKDIDNKSIWNREIVGVISDIHFKDLHHSIGNLQLQFDADDTPNSILNLRILNQDATATMDFITSVIKDFDKELKPTIEFYSEIVNEQYKQEQRQASAIRVFSIIAIFITCLGLYGKINLTVKNRIKEIGIRKVNGAKVMELIGLLNRDIIIWIGLAFIVGSPIAYIIIEKWLDGFAYKTDMSWWMFGLAGIIALLIAMISVSIKSYVTATRNPVEALRYE